LLPTRFGFRRNATNVKNRFDRFPGSRCQVENQRWPRPLRSDFGNRKKREAAGVGRRSRETSNGYDSTGRNRRVPDVSRVPDGHEMTTNDGVRGFTTCSTCLADDVKRRARRQRARERVFGRALINGHGARGGTCTGHPLPTFSAVTRETPLQASARIRSTRDDGSKLLFERRRFRSADRECPTTRFRFDAS